MKMISRLATIPALVVLSAILAFSAIPTAPVKADYFEFIRLSSDPGILGTQLANADEDILYGLNNHKMYIGPTSEIAGLNPRRLYVEISVDLAGGGETYPALGTPYGIPVLSDDEVYMGWYDYDNNPDVRVSYHVGYCDLKDLEKVDGDDYSYNAKTEYVSVITPDSRDTMPNIKDVLPALPRPSTQLYVVSPVVRYQGGDYDTTGIPYVFAYESQVPDHILRLSDHYFDPGYKGEVKRFLNPETNGHLYTTDIKEAKALAVAGWVQEAELGFSDLDKSGSAIYRVNNPATGEYIFTADKNEAKTLKNKFGWVIENGEQPVFYAAPQGSVDVYRLFNPDLPAASSHHYTSDENEIVTLIVAGWLVDNDADPVYSLYSWQEYHALFIDED